MDAFLGIHLPGKAFFIVQNLMGDTSLFDEAVRQYPIIGKQGLAYKYSPGGGPGVLEFWPGEETGTPEYQRPKEFPMGQAGVEVFNPKTRPIDILGDVASHHLINTDPVIKQHYEQFQQSLTPQQQARLTQQYLYAKKNDGEKRPYPVWAERSGLPAYFRGYAFQQWDRPEELYTPAQMQQFDKMMQYLRAPVDGQQFSGSTFGK